MSTSPRSGDAAGAALPAVPGTGQRPDSRRSRDTSQPMHPTREGTAPRTRGKRAPGHPCPGVPRPPPGGPRSTAPAGLRPLPHCSARGSVFPGGHSPPPASRGQRCSAPRRVAGTARRVGPSRPVRRGCDPLTGHPCPAHGVAPIPLGQSRPARALRPWTPTSRRLDIARFAGTAARRGGTPPAGCGRGPRARSRAFRPPKRRTKFRDSVRSPKRPHASHA